MNIRKSNHCLNLISDRRMKIMKKITTCLLLTFFFQNVIADPVYFKCEGKDYLNYHDKQRGYLEKGEVIKSLVVDKESKKVTWAGSSGSFELKYTPDLNEDGIYEFYTEDFVFDLSFNAISLLLVEVFNPDSSWHSKVEYLCKKTLPSL